MLTDERLAELREVAERANEYITRAKMEDPELQDVIAEIWDRQISAHVKAFDPPTAIELIEEVVGLRKLAERLKRESQWATDELVKYIYKHGSTDLYPIVDALKDALGENSR